MIKTTYPLESISMDAAKRLQFRIVDTITRHFNGLEVLTLGDLGVLLGQNKPTATLKAEAVFADVFDAEAAVLVRGSGTGAIRWSLVSSVKPGGTLLVHDAPIYNTTELTINSMGINILKADFNRPEELARIIVNSRSAIDAALVQHTRQKIDDGYNFCDVINKIKTLLPDIPVITDDNYAALKVPSIGVQAGADLSSFSCFKTLGPEGIGVVLGHKKYIERIIKFQYSGGSQVQGHEAMAALRGLIYAPVSLAIQSEVGEENIFCLSRK